MKRTFTLFDELDWNNLVHAKKVKELYPNVSFVHIQLKRDWCSTDVSDYFIGPDDPVHLSIDCLNPDCTRKFILTSILEQAMRTGKKKEGTIYCQGKESSKPGALLCSGKLVYIIEPIMK